MKILKSLLLVIGLLTLYIAANPKELAKLKHRKEIEKGSRVASSTIHECIFSVKLRNIDELKSIVDLISDPRSPNYGKYLTRKEVAELISNPTSTILIRAYLQQRGISIVKESRNGDSITARASVGEWESLLETEFYEFRVIDSNSRLSSPIIRAEKYSLPTALESHVEAVFNTVQMPPRFLQSRHAKSTQTARLLHSTAPPLISFGYVTPLLLSNYYNITWNPTLTQGSQGVYDFGGYYSAADLTGFEQNFFISPIASVSNDIGGHESASICADGTYYYECYGASSTLQYLIGVNPNIPTTVVFDNSSEFVVGWADVLLEMDNPPLVNAIGLGVPEADVSSSSIQKFQTQSLMLAAQGVTIITASGDNGAPGIQTTYTGVCGYHPEWPATSPYVLVMGGTQGPESDAPEISCSSETQGYITSGGGFSNYYAIPEWQIDAIDSWSSQIALVKIPTPGYNTSGRGYPDLSLMAFSYDILVGGDWLPFYGTGISAAVMAGMISISNAQRLQAGKPPLGWVNPAIYQGASEFVHDITSGNNDCVAENPDNRRLCCEQGFDALTGWDPVTGLGSVNFEMFNAYLVNLKTVSTTESPLRSSGTNEDAVPIFSTTTTIVDNFIKWAKDTLFGFS